MDESLLDDNQRSGIRMWAKMIRDADEERAVRILTKIVVNLSGDKLALDSALAATKGKAMN